MNAEEISIKVRNYFENIRGMKAHFFNIEDCVYNENEKIWNVKCNFISNPFTGEEVTYIVIAEGNGDIGHVSKVFDKVRSD